MTRASEAPIDVYLDRRTRQAQTANRTIGTMNPAPADDDLVDAHVHTLASDGALTLRQLANLAKRSGLAAFVPCDHDVIHATDDLADAGNSANVQVLSGVELTTTFGERTLHL